MNVSQRSQHNHQYDGDDDGQDDPERSCGILNSMGTPIPKTAGFCRGSFALLRAPGDSWGSPWDPLGNS